MTPFYSNPEKNASDIFSESERLSYNDLSRWDSDLYLPLNLDSEYTDKEKASLGDRSLYSLGDRLGLTVQVGTYDCTNQVIFGHWDLKTYCTENDITFRHKFLESEFFAIDFLNDCGINAKLSSYMMSSYDKKLKGFSSEYDDKNKKYPTLYLQSYSHFALAELFMAVKDDSNLFNRFLSLIEPIDPSKDNDGLSKIKMGKRLYCAVNMKENYVKLKHHIIINGKKYILKYRIIDTCALQGVASYDNLCKNLGIKNDAKKALSQDDKENMLITIFKKPDKFDKYSLGDLLCSKIVSEHHKKFELLYDDLAISERFEPPSLTIGRSVADLFENNLLAKLGINSKQETETFLEFLTACSADKFKKDIKNTRCYLAKTHGGRCRNNRPDISSLEGSLIDFDIVSAYGNILRYLDFPIGFPTIGGFRMPDTKKDYNDYPSLRKWLSHVKYGKKDSKLSPNLWVITVDGILKQKQDLIVSWDVKINDIKKSTEDDNILDPKSGIPKIFFNEVINGVITESLLQIIYSLPAIQRNDLLDNLKVTSCAYYNPKFRVNSYQELLEKTAKHRGKNTLKFSDNGEVINTDNTPKYWYSLNLGELIMDKLVSYRLFYKATDGNKGTKQEFYKLINNTVYGVLTSPYFDVNNTVVSNNITSLCRAFAYLMEKSLYGFECITDGVQCDLNKVVYPLSGEGIKGNLVKLYQKQRQYNLKQHNVKLAPIGGYDSINIIYHDDKPCLELINGDSKEIKEFVGYDKNFKPIIIPSVSQWIGNLALEHIKKCFPNIPFLDYQIKGLKLDIEASKLAGKPILQDSLNNVPLFTIEPKLIFDYASFHGTANYLIGIKNDYKSFHLYASLYLAKNVLKFNISLQKYILVLAEMISKIAMRSYENKLYTFYNEGLEAIFQSKQGEKFLKELFENPYAIPRQYAYHKKGILKINSYNQRDKLHNKYLPGDSIKIFGLLKEISMSQFTYNTLDQYRKIESEMARNKRKYGQTYEMYFLNEDDSLNYQKAILEIEDALNSGVTNLNAYFDKHHNNRRKLLEHPYYQTLIKLKETGLEDNTDNENEFTDLPAGFEYEAD